LGGAVERISDLDSHKIVSMVGHVIDRLDEGQADCRLEDLSVVVIEG
jgi:hypothetical protein